MGWRYWGGDDGGDLVVVVEVAEVAAERTWWRRWRGGSGGGGLAAEGAAQVGVMGERSDGRKGVMMLNWHWYGVFPVPTGHRLSF